jgi:hypothetical protein
MEQFSRRWGSGDDMLSRFFAGLAVVSAAPAAFAQAPSAENALPPFYVSGGLVWSDELGLQVEAGGQWQIGDSLRLRLSPANISLIDGDTPDGFYLDSNNDCRFSGSNQPAIQDECSPEPDTEWRAVAEAQWRVAPGFYIGGGASYILQGDFDADIGRTTPFASVAWDLQDALGVELRAGQDYFALRLRGLW